MGLLAYSINTSLSWYANHIPALVSTLSVHTLLILFTTRLSATLAYLRDTVPMDTDTSTRALGSLTSVEAYSR